MKGKKLQIFVISLLGYVKCAEDSARYNCLLQSAVVSAVLSGVLQRPGKIPACPTGKMHVLRKIL